MRHTAPEGSGSQAARHLRAVGRRIAGFNELGILSVLILMCAVIGIFHSEFLARDSLTNIAQQASLYGIMALGMVFLLSMREIDLSVGSIYGLTIMCSAILMSDGLNPWLGALLGLVIGAALGGINGLLVYSLKIPTIIVTLGTLSVFRGLALVLSANRFISGLPRENSFFRIFGGSLFRVPASVWAFGVLTVALILVYRSTRFGFVIRAIGSNEQAARFSGIPIARVRLQALMLMGLLCGVSGMLTLAFFQSADPNLGVGYELLVIAAAIIGGTGLGGGSGSVLGALLGALMIGVITSGLIQFGVTQNWSNFATGIVIIGAVSLDAFIRRRRAPR